MSNTRLLVATKRRVRAGLLVRVDPDATGFELVRDFFRFGDVGGPDAGSETL